MKTVYVLVTGVEDPLEFENAKAVSDDDYLYVSNDEGKLGMFDLRQLTYWYATADVA